MPKNVNYYQNKKINEQLKKNRANVDIDAIELKIREMLILNGFNTSEIAAVLFTVMRNVLLYERNREFLDKVGINPRQLNTEVVVEIQKLLIKEYLNGLNETGTATKA
ncbi:hypothetical protein [Proteiniclasticum ruminis]|jgi:hypothetical protein|uniref:Uncharacterized protein n=1 Tax=Proteiniclasticum ruminis TaxID=398199 RepID=A0A1I4ZM96_9CLOT|nr:hypothetical protein [Proteiniclasticum ruminis]SFN51089.1 hypothetical protein SAMN04488695_10246 [Proteiniclasticum ruminis]